MRLQKMDNCCHQWLESEWWIEDTFYCSDWCKYLWLADCISKKIWDILNARFKLYHPDDANEPQSNVSKTI